MSFTIPSIDEVRTLGLNAITNTEDKTENAMVYDAVASGAIMAHELLSFAKNAFDKMDIENNSGDDLNRYVFLRTGITRKMGTLANGKLLFAGTPGTLVPQGYIVTDANNNVSFKTLYGDVITEGGTVLIDAVSTVVGYQGYITADSLTVMTDKRQGITSVTNTEDMEEGTDPETDAQLRTRYYMFFRDRATSNNPAHYRQWAMEVDGVGQVRVVRAFNGPLSVKVILLDNRYQSADGELINNVDAHIRTRQSFDVEELLVVSATPILINIDTDLILADGYDDAQVKNNIADNIRNWLSDYIDPLWVRESVSYYDIISIVKQTEGVIDINTLTVNGGTANIPIGIEQVAEMGTVT